MGNSVALTEIGSNPSTVITANGINKDVVLPLPSSHYEESLGTDESNSTPDSQRTAQKLP